MHEIVKALLGWIDKPWKAVALVVILVVGGTGYLLYLNRTEIASAILVKHKRASLLVDKFVSTGEELLDSTKADLATLYAVDLATNTEYMVKAIDRTATSWKGSVLKHAIIDDTTSPEMFVSLIEGKPFCFNISLDSTRYEMREAAEAGIKRECAIAIPPVIGTFVGVVAIGWKVPPSQAIENNAKREIRSTALQLADY